MLLQKHLGQNTSRMSKIQMQNKTKKHKTRMITTTLTLKASYSKRKISQYYLESSHVPWISCILEAVLIAF